MKLVLTMTFLFGGLLACFNEQQALAVNSVEPEEVNLTGKMQGKPRGGHPESCSVQFERDGDGFRLLAFKDSELYLYFFIGQENENYWLNNCQSSANWDSLESTLSLTCDGSDDGMRISGSARVVFSELNLPEHVKMSISYTIDEPNGEVIRSESIDCRELRQD